MNKFAYHVSVWVATPWRENRELAGWLGCCKPLPPTASNKSENTKGIVVARATGSSTFDAGCAIRPENKLCPGTVAGWARRHRTNDEDGRTCIRSSGCCWLLLLLLLLLVWLPPLPLLLYVAVQSLMLYGGHHKSFMGSPSTAENCQLNILSYNTWFIQCPHEWQLWLSGRCLGIGSVLGAHAWYRNYIEYTLTECGRCPFRQYGGGRCAGQTAIGWMNLMGNGYQCLDYHCL